MNASKIRFAVLFWVSLLAAIALVVVVFGHRSPDPSICADRVEHALIGGGSETLRLPLRMTPPFFGRTVETFRIVFRNRLLANRPVALYIGEATPFVHVRLNGIEETPSVALANRYERNLAPQIFPLSHELVGARSNLIELRIPLDYRLNDLRLDQICLANTDALDDVWHSSWLQQVLIPRLCLSVLASMLLMALFMFRLMGRDSAMLAYVLVIVMANVRVLYLAIPFKPGSPLVWRTLADLSMVLVVWAIYRLIRALWSYERVWLDRALLIMVVGGTGAMLLTLVWPWHLLYPRVQALFWLAVAFSAIGLALAMAGAVSKAHPAEWRPVMWAMLFGSLISALEAATYHLPMSQRFIWTYPVGITVIVCAFGSVILRRAVLGVFVLQRAKHVLANDLDVALQHIGQMPNERIVDELKLLSAYDERQRVLKDIHDGFGSRLVTVLGRLQREHPASTLQQDMQRALIDLRLMIDAMDDAARSLDVAFAMLRHRLQPSLEAQGIDVRWDTGDLPSQQIDDRRKLMNLYRIVEEAISNILQHAKATRVDLSARYAYGELVVSIRDDGRGMPPQSPCGRGRGNIRRRVLALNGSLEEGPGIDGGGYGMTLRIPRM